MRLRCLLTVAAALGLLLLGQSTAKAQGGPIDIQMFKPAMDSKGHFSIDSTQVLAPWHTSFGLLGNYANNPLVLKSDDGRFFETNHLVGANLQFAIGMMKLSKRGKPWLEIGFGLPISFHQSKMGASSFSRRTGDSLCSTGVAATDGCTVWQQDWEQQEKYPLSYDSSGGFAAQGLGDLYLHFKFRFLDTSTSPFGVGAMLTMYFPSSKVGDGHLKMMGTGGFTLAPKLLMDWRWRKAKVLLSLNVGARIRFNTTGELRENDGWSNCSWADVSSGNGLLTPLSSTVPSSGNPCGEKADGYGFNANQGDNGLSWRVKTLYEITYGLGLSWRIGKSVAWVNEIFGSVELSSLAAEDGASSAGQIGVDLGYTPKYYKNVFPIEFLTGFKFYLAANSYFAVGGGVGITGLIGDHVGAPDFRVTVSFVFEPSTGDRDGDGIMDDVDKCPDNPEDFDDFEDKNGCPDPDNDKDGIPDVDDKCPNVPENFNGFQDKDGCPDNIDGDRDGDGIPDSKDKCPDVPEDKDHFEDKDGCPDPDNDGDGVTDKSDKCPGYDSDKRDNFVKVKEDKDGFEDEDGCPDPDNDKDGILDNDDKCPNEPENFNQYKDEDGCPDKSPITITKDRVLIMEKIYFETNKAKIRSISFPILNTVAKTLIAHKELKIIEIQGHTDERGSNRHNLRLSQRRANSVRNYLINKGVGADRVTARGYGENQPKCRQSTRACWSKNRRSEFIIIKRD